ncbi:retrovirus-related pol polyprotein from transposon TNT 1-94, partial [Tanacetum coccineum]
DGTDYDETFALVATLEAIRIFLAFATYMNFTIYQMDVKSAFLNGKLKEEVYVKQTPSFKSSEFPNHVCKLDKALYGIKQAPRAWYLKGNPSLGLWYPKCLGFDLKDTQTLTMLDTTWTRKALQVHFCTQEQSILTSDITLSEIISLKGTLNYISFPLNTNLMISSPSL